MDQGDEMEQNDFGAASVLIPGLFDAVDVCRVNLNVKCISHLKNIIIYIQNVIAVYSDKS